MAGLVGSSRSSFVWWFLLLALIGFSGGDAGISISNMHRQKGGGDQESGARTSRGATRNLGLRLGYRCRMHLRGGAKKLGADAAANHVDVDASKTTKNCAEDTGSAPAHAPAAAAAPAAPYAQACDAHCQSSTAENLEPSHSRPSLIRRVLTAMTQCFVKPEARKSRSHFPLGSRQRTLSLPSDVERKLASMVDASSAGGTAGEEGSEARQDRMERVRARANNAMSQGGALVNMNPAAIDSYEGGYAALHWNADGTCAQGLVPVQYESSVDSKDSMSSFATASPAANARKGLARVRRMGEAVIRRAQRGRECLGGGGRGGMEERVRQVWEQDGFKTYVPLSQWSDGEEPLPDEFVDEIADKWLAASPPSRARLFTAEVMGDAHICATRGRRGGMEDTFSVHPPGGLATTAVLGGEWLMFGLYDGHGGDKAALYCRKNLLRNTASLFGESMHDALEKGFEMTDRHFVADAERNEWIDGSTALVAALSKDVLVIANAGDSRAVLATLRPGQSSVDVAMLSTDHSPSSPSEEARIQAMGGLVVHKGGVGRVMGVLGVSRAIGDVQLRPYVSAEPEVRSFGRGESDLFLIMATDGLWESLSSEDAADLVHRCMQDPGFTGNLAEVLAKEAYGRGSTDNISVIVKDLRRNRSASLKVSDSDEEE